MKKRLIFLSLIIIWLIVIFLFSSNNGSESNYKSKSLINKGIIIYEKITNKDVNNKLIIKKLNYPIRKFAHFIIFLVLGIFIYLYINTYKINNKLILSIFLCLIFAIFDEIHQIHVISRTPQILDIFIDLCGSITSVSFLNLFELKKLQK